MFIASRQPGSRGNLRIDDSIKHFAIGPLQAHRSPTSLLPIVQLQLNFEAELSKILRDRSRPDTSPS